MPLICVPGPEGVHGSERDLLAKQGSRETFVGPKAFSGITKDATKNDASVSNKENTELLYYLNNQLKTTVGCTVSKTMISSLFETYSTLVRVSSALK